MSDCAIPVDSSPPGSPIPGILQARTLEWVAIFFSNAWKWKVKVKSLSCARLLATPWTAAYQAPPSMGFSRQEYRSGVPLPSPSIGISARYSTEVYSSSSKPTSTNFKIILKNWWLFHFKNHKTVQFKICGGSKDPKFHPTFILKS